MNRKIKPISFIISLITISCIVIISYVDEAETVIANTFELPWVTISDSNYHTSGDYTLQDVVSQPNANLSTNNNFGLAGGFLGINFIGAVPKPLVPPISWFSVGGGGISQGGSYTLHQVVTSFSNVAMSSSYSVAEEFLSVIVRDENTGFMIFLPIVLK